MIPVRVKLQGFLSYKEEQEVRFGDSALWLLAGLNGSGKSSVFDAVTYSLFGHHRAGSLEAQELINKESDSLGVEFDFVLDGQTYRAKRTLRRNPRGNATATRQIYRRELNGAGIETWSALEGTRQEKQFKDWIRENIGLTYETFTSSVLLLQGKAEKLLDSTAKGRAEVLASIVDLERYQKLHEKADSKRKALKWEVEALAGQLNAIPEVTEFELEAAANQIDDADEA